MMCQCKQCDLANTLIVTFATMHFANDHIMSGLQLEADTGFACLHRSGWSVLHSESVAGPVHLCDWCRTGGITSCFPPVPGSGDCKSPEPG